MISTQAWWHADEGHVHERVYAYVSTVERNQSAIYERFLRCAFLYDPNCHNSALTGLGAGIEQHATENVIASSVDTVVADIAVTDIRARFMTDDGDWSTRKTARQLGWYANALATLLKVPEKCRAAFKNAAIKGTGLIKVYIDGFDEIQVEHVHADDVIVDEVECRSSAPRQMHQRAHVAREVLQAQFPEYADEIERACDGAGRTWRNWAGYRQRERHEVMVLESWFLPIGKPDKKGYKPGRHTICIDGCDLVDEEWTFDRFPFARMVWTERVSGWYGISGVERIVGLQRALNKRSWQIEKQLDRAAVPTTFVDLADANIANKRTNQIGSIAVYKGRPPVTVTPQAVSNETYQSRETLKAAAFEEFGVSRLSATSRKPAGLDSAVALREYRDQASGRFSIQDKAFEALWLDVILLIIACCKQLGAEAPTLPKQNQRFGSKRIKWSQVDLDDATSQIQAASTLSQTPAGRQQTVLEWAQAGIVSTDEARMLLDHPDIEGAMSLVTAAIEDINAVIEAIEDGHIVMPEPYENLQLGCRLVQQAYLRDLHEGAPEEVLEGLRQWITQAAFMLSTLQQPPANENVPPGMLPQAAPANGNAAPNAAAPPLPGDAMALPPTG